MNGTKGQAKMMTTAEAKKYINHDHYLKYCELGGELGENRYRYIAAMFVRHTLDIFVGGDPKFYNSRREAVEAFQTWANKYGSRESWNRIFKSIDLVTPYT